ncbi:calcium/sodium antiporter [Marinobacter zhanjiangensis]|uniref:Sodium:calcium antiporter n=1 Tax=Marinobacter zhanjiangensis TaxID=578215 RepID=A0ABQ3B1H1_9GAMM|nr:calcium/sodium antiporter [Marinobacter zhanjiangensis]GGY70564.1 sodium:calcium antiporter [Marinobacter zhanjiangensis]
MTWMLLGAGLVLLIIGAELLVRGAARLAASFGVPALVIGLTVVAFGTSAPELAVSMKSAWSGQTELAIANVVGSNIFNVLFILGLAAVVSPLMVSRQLIRQDVPIMILISAVAAAMAWDGILAFREAVVLFTGLIVYTVFLFIQGRRKGPQLADGDVAGLSEKAVPAWRNLLLVVAGLVLLVMGSRWLVQSAVTIAGSLGVSEAVIGLTIIAAGTSLPEVMTSVMATLRGQRDIAIGNVVGSNVFNLLCVLGLSGLVSPEPLVAGSQMASLDIPVMLGVALLCLPLFFTGAALTRFEGSLFLMLYVCYVWYMVALALAVDYLPTLQVTIGYGLIPLVVLVVAGLLGRDLIARRRSNGAASQ